MEGRRTGSREEDEARRGLSYHFSCSWSWFYDWLRWRLEEKEWSFAACDCRWWRRRLWLEWRTAGGRRFQAVMVVVWGGIDDEKRGRRLLMWLFLVDEAGRDGGSRVFFWFFSVVNLYEEDNRRAGFLLVLFRR